MTQIKLAILGVVTVVGGWFGLVPMNHVQAPAPEVIVVERDQLGAYGVTGGSTYRLKASIGTTDTTLSLSMFKEPVSNIKYTMAYLNTTVAYATIDPQSTRPEFVSFTNITQNADGSATLTGVTRGLTKTPQGSACTASSTLAVRHPGQSIFILSDSPCHQAEYAVKRNDETITGQWGFPTPSTATSAATKGYVDGLALGGTATVDKLIVTGTAGETVQAGQILYLGRADGEWYKADADQASTSVATLLGVAQGAGTDGVAISGGVLLQGIDSNQGNMAAGRLIYLSGTAGATSTSAGTIDKRLGMARTVSQLYFNPWADGSFATTTSATSTIGVLNVTASTTTRLLRATATSSLATTTVNNVVVTDIGKSGTKFTASGTWTKPAGVTRIKLTVVGAGGSGGGSSGSNSGAGGGGGGGATCIAYVDVTATTTVNYIVGAGVAGDSDAGSAGGTSIFSTYCQSTGGGAGARGINSTVVAGGTAGAATLGDILIPGEPGGYGQDNGVDVNAIFGGKGGNSMYGFGGIIHGHDNSSSAEAGTGFGAGGAGATAISADGNGGSSTGGVIIIEW